MSDRDFRCELSGVRCWDRTTQELYQRHGEPLDDCILQNREELIALCAFIEAHRVRSYLEIGVWTGRLISTLHRLFDFERVAACDDGYARRFGLSIGLPPGTVLFEGDSGSGEFERWRASLGHIDLVFIDANHHEAGVRRDFEINRAHPHRFLAFHDIAGNDRHTRGVRRFWESLAEGHKLSIVRHHLELGPERPGMGIGIWSG